MCAETAGRYREVAQYVDRRMGGPGPVFTTKEGAFFYHTQRPAVSVYPALGLAPDRLAAYLRDRGAAIHPLAASVAARPSRYGVAARPNARSSLLLSKR